MEPQGVPCMSRRAKAFLMLLFLTTTRCFSTGNASSVSVTVDVFNDAATPRSVVEFAEQEASRIFIAAGLEMTWVDCLAKQENVLSAGCPPSRGPTHLNLRILPHGKRVKEDSFGVAFLATDGAGTYIDVFYDAVEKLHHESNTSPGRLLGHVMAHEIGHLLIGSNAHSNWGIMCPVWSRRELRGIEMGSVFFTGDQARRMRNRLLSPVVMAEQKSFERLAATITCSESSAARNVGNLKGQKNEIPFGLYNGNLIIVKATVGSVKNVNFILDTGTSPTVIDQAMADRFNLRGTSALLQTLTGTIQVQSVTLPRIQIGSLHADSITGLVEDLTFLKRSLGISLGGIAGLDILRSSSFTIDYGRQKIIFGYIAGSEKTVHFETQIPYLSIKAKIAGQEVRLLVDSGTGGLLVYRNRFRTTVEQLNIDPSASISTATGGGTHVRWLSTEVSLEKGSLGARKVAIADVNSDPQNDFDGLFGLTTMGFRKVSFDFENGLFGWE